ncbi:MAG TPA: hypothetical protein VFO14_10490 [Vicinamibacterales bacterium]|jgi:hypothetical protein|nr:hypothetical protein [Vicinamibacterales bacterium]
MWKRTVVAAALAVAAFTTASAQDNATFTLRSGERITGRLVDLAGSGFTIQVNGQNRTIPTRDMALIEFAGGNMSQADWDRLNTGQHVIWLRNGDTITGQLYDVSGTTPKRITIKTDGAERQLTSSEISRIALARPTSTQATTGSSGDGITVSSKARWTPTGMTVQRGETLVIRADGEIRISPDPNDRATPNGIVAERYDPQAPLPRTLTGALIGRIGNGQPFGIGMNATFQAPGTGQLFLGINDSNVSDNDGAFQVTVQRSARR